MNCVLVVFIDSVSQGFRLNPTSQGSKNLTRYESFILFIELVVICVLMIIIDTVSRGSD